jgi:signal transduction histidine kinase
MNNIERIKELENEIDLLKKENLKLNSNHNLDFFDSFKDMFQVIELIYDSNGKAINYYYRAVNKAFEDLVNKPKEEIINKKVKDLFGVVEDHWIETWEKVLKTGNSESFEDYSAELDKHYEVYAWKVNDREVASIFNEITQRKQNELELKKAHDKLIEFSISKEKLYQVITHDLRSPFNSILGFSELLIDNSNNYDKEKVLEYSKALNTTAKNTLNLLNNLLDWEKSQNDYIHFNPKNLKLSSVIKAVLKNLKSNAILKNISLNFNPLVDFEVYADLNMLNTVLRNFISNAIKFTNSNGAINIYIALINDSCEVIISDNGIGMNEEMLANFNNNNNSLAFEDASYNDTGLGLLICKEFVARNNGKFVAESKLGKGSDFKFTLSLNKF